MECDPVFMRLTSSAPMISLSIQVCGWLLVSAMSAYANPDLTPLKVLAGQSPVLKMCGSPGADTLDCKALATALVTGEDIHEIAPTDSIPSRGDPRFSEIGGNCPPDGETDAGQPLAHLDMYADGWQAVPSGPFNRYDLSSAYKDWRPFWFASTSGFEPVGDSSTLPGRLAWKEYFIIPRNDPCNSHVVWAGYFGDHSQTSTLTRADGLVEWNKRVFLVSVEELAENTHLFHTTVMALEATPNYLAAGGTMLSLVMSFHSEPGK